MKALLSAILIIAFPSSLLSENRIGSDAERAVRSALESLSSGRYTGSTEKDLEKLGDASALALITIYSDRPLKASDIEAALLVIDLSFSAPKLVASEADRDPRATMLLLKYLDCSAAQPEIKQRIAQTRKTAERARRELQDLN